MRFPLNAYLLAVLSALITTLLSVPLWKRWCLRMGLIDEPGQRKIHAEPVPLAGGLAVMTGLLVPAILGSLLLFFEGRSGGSISSSGGESRPIAHLLIPLSENATFLLHHGLTRRAINLLGIFAGAAGILAVGFLDDKYELRARSKFIGQLLVAALVATSGVRITLFVPNIGFHYAITILWILALINAFNFMDNMNGLCAGLAAIGAWYFGLIAAWDGQYLVALVAFLTFGAVLGFLPYNFPRARVFLGDSGSHLLGYLLAVLAILPHFYTSRHPHRWAVTVPLLILAVPLLDLVWVVMLRWRSGQPFYHGDTNHLSHRVVRLGLSSRTAVLLIWLAAALVGTVGLLIGHGVSD